MTQVVMIVGPDMTGKTEIAKEFSRQTGISYFKATSERDTYLNKKDLFINQLRYADMRVFDLLKQTKLPIIFDRAYPCEMSYSQVFRRPTDLEMLSRVDEAYASIGTKIVVCYRSSYEGIVDDIDPGITAAVLANLTEAYREFARQSKCEVYFLNVDDEDLEREVAEVRLFIGA